MSVSSDPILLPLPDLEQFNVSERDGLRLITPKKMKFSWETHERPYRSVILGPDGEVLSTGLPKFGNLGEPSFADHQQIFDAELAAGGRVVHSYKEDGSLAIRSVIDGQVVFRTRGSFDGGPFGPAMRRVAAEKYPVLLDPDFMPDRSLLFEFVSSNPQFRVVLSYDEDDLVFLNAVTHHDLRMADWPELETVAADHDLKLVQALELPTDLDDLVAQVTAWERMEGIVARAADGQVLVKVKSASYLALHRIKSHLNANSIRQLCSDHDVQSVSDFADILVGQGGDWEMVSDAEPLVRTYLRAAGQADERFSQLRAEVTDAKARFPQRKDFAVQFATKLPGAEKSAAFLLLDDKISQAHDALKRATLDDAFAAAAAQDEQRAEMLDDE